MALAIVVVAFRLLDNLLMRMLLPISLLVGLLPVACDAARVTLHDSHEVKALTSRQDLLLMANERQVVHYRYLAAEQVGAASRLAEGGDVAGTTRMLFSAIEYQALAEEIEEQTADRLATQVSASAGQREPR
jgi:cell division protein FtsL